MKPGATIHRLPTTARVPQTPAPRHLSREARALWREIEGTWHLGPDGRALLTTAAEALDRLRLAQRIVRREGLVYTSPRGAKRAHPAVRIEVEARRALIAALNALHLEGEAVAGRFVR
jgi:P27 family predicted phage terminase small subunit